MTMVGAEPCAPYNRVLLSAALAGEVGDPDLALDDTCWRSAVSPADRCAGHGARPRATHRANCRRSRGKLRSRRARHRLVRPPLAHSWRRPAGSKSLPRSRRPRRNQGGGARKAARRGDRRRVARHRSRCGARQARRDGDARSSHGSTDGAPARSALRLLPQARGRAAQGRSQARRRDSGDCRRRARERTGVCRRRAARRRSRRHRRWRAPQYRAGARCRASRSIAGSSSTKA